MNLKNRKFTDLSTGRVVEIRDHFEDIAILNDNSKIRVNRLMDKNYFEEYIDPKSFFKNESLLSSFAEKIRQLPNDAVTRANDDPRDTEQLVQESRRTGPVDLNNIPGSTVIRPMTSESAVLPYDPEEEKMELMRKAKSMYGNVSLDESLQKQYDSLRNILEDDNPNVPVVEPHRPRVPENRPRPQSSDPEPGIQRIEVSRDDESGEVISRVPDRGKPVEEDPILVMFKNVKRNAEFSISIPVSEKIPKASFIELMEENYNKSIIDFLAQEFTDNIVNNPDRIKQMIKERITEMVYPESESKEEVEKAPKTTVKKARTSPKKESGK